MAESKYPTNILYGVIILRQVYDGADDTGTLIGTYCGSDATAPPPTLSTGPNAFVRFVTDATTHGTGFQGSYDSGNAGELRSTAAIEFKNDLSFGTKFYFRLRLALLSEFLQHKGGGGGAHTTNNSVHFNRRQKC